MTVTEHSNKVNAVDPQEAAERIAAVGDMGRLKDSGAFDELMAQIDRGEIELEGKCGFIQQLIKASLERGLKAELSDHLGYDQGDAARQRRIRVTVPIRRPCPRRQGTLSWLCSGTDRARSSRDWCPRASGAPAGSMT